MAETEKPSVTEAIGWAYAMIKAHQKAEDFPASYSRPKINEEKLRRLVEAGEFEQQFCKQAWWWRDRRCPDCTEKDRRIVWLEKAMEDVRNLSSQLDTLEKENAEKDRRIDRLKTLCKGLKWHSKRVFENFAELCVETCDLRSQLAEERRQKESETVDADKWLNVGLQRLVEIEALKDQLAEREGEIERLKDELDDLRLSTTPGFIKAMGLIDEGLTKGKLEIEKVRKVIKIIPEDSPTDAEVEKVGERLYLGHTTSSGLMKKAFCVLYGDEKIRWYSVARHVLKRGYRPEGE